MKLNIFVPYPKKLNLRHHQSFIMIACCLMIGCSQNGNTQTTANLAGTWVQQGTDVNGYLLQSRIVVGTNGNYQATVTMSDTGTATVRTSAMSGVFQVKQGALIDTVINHSDTNAILPWTTRGKIIRFTNQELAVKWEHSDQGQFPTNLVTFRREK